MKDLASEFELSHHILAVIDQVFWFVCYLLSFAARFCLRRGRSRTVTNEGKSAGRKRSNSESSSSSPDVTDSKRRAKKNYSRKERNGTSESDSVAELEWIPRDAAGSYCELVGSTKSDIRKGYDINLVNPERMQSAVGNSEDRQKVYGPVVPPGESAKKNNDRPRDKIVTAGTERNRSTSSSRSSSSSSASSSSNRNRSPELTRKKGNQQRKTKRSTSTQPSRRKSIKSSKKPNRIGDRPKSNETKKRGSGEYVSRSLSSRNQERHRSRDRSTDRKSVASRRDSRNSGIFKKADGKKRRSSTSSDEARGNAKKRRSSRSRREHSLEQNRRTSFDHSMNKSRITNESRLSQSPSKNLCIAWSLESRTADPM